MLLIQEIFGVGAYIRAVGERLAALGYVVGAPDVFWRIQPNWESDHTPEGVEASLGMVQKFDFPQGVADCVAALHALEELPEVQGGVGVVGFCLGGTLGYLTAAVAEPDLLRQLLRLGDRRDAGPARQHRVPDALPLR